MSNDAAATRTIMSALPAGGCTSPAVIHNGEVLVGFRNGELAAFSLPG